MLVGWLPREENDDDDCSPRRRPTSPGPGYLLHRECGSSSAAVYGSLVMRLKIEFGFPLAARRCCHARIDYQMAVNLSRLVFEMEWNAMGWGGKQGG